MKFENLFHIMLICFLGLTACKGKQREDLPRQQVRLSLSADSSAVELHGLPADVLESLGTDSLGEKQWQSFFGVYSDPGDPELKDLQRPVSGSYSVKDSIISFVPAEEFEKDSLYFTRFYSRYILDKPSDVIMGEGGISAQAEVVEFVFKR
jgi:hypothetical protein